MKKRVIFAVFTAVFMSIGASNIPSQARRKVVIFFIAVHKVLY
jgi:hypothetical protein